MNEKARDKSYQVNKIERARFVDEQGHDVITPLARDNMQMVDGTLQFYMEEGIPSNIRPFYVVLEGRLEGKGKQLLFYRRFKTNSGTLFFLFRTLSNRKMLQWHLPSGDSQLWLVTSRLTRLK